MPDSDFETAPDSTAQPPRLLYCRCAYAQVVPQQVKDSVLEKLCESGASFESVADLCEMAAHRDPRLQAFATQTPLRIAACYPRVVRGLFQQCNATLPQDDDQIQILNMRTQSPEEIAAAMLDSPPV
ncbi:hypothetical protein FEM03_13815 [Phragmitibacter flavus]|uniref:Uncharacterized protein n=1 Tax=Phragmitibacter flavus TaxID=2576071 RepID=A0A5R8KDD7_9BACT|nr:hypothetical protein [Phragmitibacter flavus]TLD70257.1 hypothetical protein FEM03_13815 [Phragmitibacter flavus]